MKLPSPFYSFLKRTNVENGGYLRANCCILRLKPRLIRSLALISPTCNTALTCSRSCIGIPRIAVNIGIRAAYVRVGLSNHRL